MPSVLLTTTLTAHLLELVEGQAFRVEGGMVVDETKAAMHASCIRARHPGA